MFETILKLLGFRIHEPDPEAEIQAFVDDHRCSLKDGPLVDDPYDAIDKAQND